MWIPKHFAMPEAEALEVIRAHSFATLVTVMDGQIEGTHVPILLDEEHGRLVGHVARANRQWESFDGEREALAIFQGPHAYISPSWYPPGFAVPTWDYVAVHVYGKPRLIEDEADVLRLLDQTVASYEEDRERPWRLSDQPRERVAAMSHGVVAFEMEIGRIEGKAKLGQNRPDAQDGVIASLEASTDTAEREMGRLVRRARGDE